MRTQLYLSRIPVVLRDAMEQRSRTLGISINALVADVLAARYGLEVSQAKRSGPPFKGGEYVRPDGQAIGVTMNLSLPATVVEAVRADSAASGTRQRTLVLSHLAAALNVQLPTDPKPRNRGHGRPRGRMVKT